MNLKLSRRDKRALQVLAIVLILTGTIITMFYPERINYNYSLKGIKDKQSNIKDLKNQLSSNKSIIEEKTADLDMTQKLANESQKKANLIRRNMKKESLTMHIPSLLITLEQNAIKNKIDLHIKYNEIKTYSDENTEINKDNKANNEDEDVEKNKDKQVDKDKNVKYEEAEDEAQTIEENKITKTENDEEIKIEEEEEGENEKEVVIDETSKRNEEKQKTSKIPSIEGISVTLVPISIEGSYKNMREYLRFLDKIDFLEPNNIYMISDGDSIKGNVIIYIFHKEVY